MTGRLALSARDLSKTFSGSLALAEVDIDLEPGEIRALVGENGSGKSTLVKILAGVYEPDPGGTLSIFGTSLVMGAAWASDAAGLRFVHQDLGMVAGLNAIDNLALGHGYKSFRTGRIRWREEERFARHALNRLGYNIDVRRAVGDLTMSERTAIAVARALTQHRSEARVLVLDEPTASLPDTEAERLFALIKSVSSSGVAVLFVSHHLQEVFEVADSVTVLRDGRNAGTFDVSAITEGRLVALMIGHELTVHRSKSSATERISEPVFSVRNVSGKVIRNFHLDLRGGEIVGIAGITGSGREELAPILFGAASRSGTVSVNGVPVIPNRPDLSVAAGVGMVPAERHDLAAFLDFSLRENITVVNSARHVVRGVLRRGREKSDVATWLSRLQVRPADTEIALALLSGGNQQKVVLARWLRLLPKVLILDDPTQGVDIGAKDQIHRMIEDAAAEGTPILILSSDYGELARLCHRVLVLRSGRIMQELRAPELDIDQLTASAVSTDRETPNLDDDFKDVVR